MQFITFPPRKIGQKIEENKLQTPAKQAQIDEAMSRRPFVTPVFTETPEPRNNAVTDKSDLIVPGAQPKLAGRSWPALKESKSYDEKRMAESPLFRETGKLF